MENSNTQSRSERWGNNAVKKKKKLDRSFTLNKQGVIYELSLSSTFALFCDFTQVEKRVSQTLEPAQDLGLMVTHFR